MTVVAILAEDWSYITIEFNTILSGKLRREYSDEQTKRLRYTSTNRRCWQPVGCIEKN